VPWVQQQEGSRLRLLGVQLKEVGRFLWIGSKARFIDFFDITVKNKGRSAANPFDLMRIRMVSEWESRIAFVKFDPVFPRLLEVVFLFPPSSLDAVKCELPLVVNVLCSMLNFFKFFFLLYIFAVSLLMSLFLLCTT